MSKYQNGKIYKIVDVGYSKCYIGSTCEQLSKRMSRHRRKYNAFLNSSGNFVSSYRLFEEFGLENCKIELIEIYPCESKEELLKREGHYIKENDCVNKNIAGRTDEEYRFDNRQKSREAYVKKKEEGKTYYQLNKEKVSEKQKAKVKCAVCMCEIAYHSMPKHTKSVKHSKNLQEHKVNNQ